MKLVFVWKPTHLEIRRLFQPSTQTQLSAVTQERPREYIIHLLFHIVRNHGKVPCVVFDNADHFDVTFQEAAFNYAYSICSKSISLMILPITDTTSWQLSKQGPMQSFFTDSFFLPTPPTELVLRRRIEYIERKVTEEQLESGKRPHTATGYFTSRGLRLEVQNINGFAACLQTVFVNTGQVADWIGRLSNHDIRRSLQLACDIVASPHIRVEELLAAWVSKTTMAVNADDVKAAMIRGKYDIYFPTIQSFVQNVFNLVPEYETTPLMTLRILQFLNENWEANKDNDSRYVPVSEVVDYFRAMNIESRAAIACLDQMMERGLCLGYDPTATKVADATKVEISPSGRHHKQWALRDWSYIEAMAEVTPLYDADVASEIRDLSKDRAPHLRRMVISRFISYLMKEDANFCAIPKHCTYSGQEGIAEVLVEQVKALSTLAEILQSGSFHRSTGRLVSWKAAGYGFIKMAGCDDSVYCHISDVLDETVQSIPEGTHVEFDVIQAAKGLRAVRIVLLQ